MPLKKLCVCLTVVGGLGLVSQDARAQSAGCITTNSAPSPPYDSTSAPAFQPQALTAGEFVSLRTRYVVDSGPREARVEVRDTATMSLLATFNFPDTGVQTFQVPSTQGYRFAYLKTNSANFVTLDFSCQTGAATITGLSAATGPSSGGTQVTITGTNLSGAGSVTFGGVAAAFAVPPSQNTQIVVTAPPGSVGVVDVQVVAANGDSATGGTADDFTYTSVPTPVPTLDEWAMIAFGLGLAGLSALMIGRRRPRHVEIG